jgi:hypothetical protein
VAAAPLTVLERYLRQLHVAKGGMHAGGVEQSRQPLLMRRRLRAQEGRARLSRFVANSLAGIMATPPRKSVAT